MFERVEGRAHHIVRIGGAQRFGYDVLHTERLEHRTHGTAGDDAGSGRSRAQEHAAGTVTPGNVVVQRSSFA